MAKDMTTGSPVKLILTFSIPLLIGNVFQQFYSMVDTIIVGRYVGVNALAAVGTTGALSFLVIGFTIGMTGGFGILVSQKFGAKDDKGLRRAVASAMTLAIATTIIITTLSLLLANPLLELINTPSDIIEDASKYIRIVFAGIFATLFYNMISSILRALGDSKTPLYFLIVASILNIFLDLLFIRSFNMGVAGAAYATVISQAVSALLCLIYALKKYSILRLKKDDFKFRSDYIKRHLKVGVPMALQFSITALGSIILQSALNVFGSTTIAAYTAASKVEQLVMQPAVTFGVTMATYSGQNLGAGRLDRIKEGVAKCTIICIIVSIISSLVVILFGDLFVKLFIDNPSEEILSLSSQYLNTVSFFFIPLGLIFIYRNTLQGIGDGFMPMMAGVAELLARVLVAFILPGIIGFAGICFAGPAAWLAAAIPLGIAYFIKIGKLVPKEKTSELAS